MMQRSGNFTGNRRSTCILPGRRALPALAFLLLTCVLPADNPAAAQSAAEVTADWISAPISFVRPHPVHLTIAALIAAAWLAIAVLAIVRGERSRQRAAVAENWGLRMRGLLATTPGAYLIIGAQGSASCSDTLRTWLAIGERISSLDQLAPSDQTGLIIPDYAALRQDIDAAIASGEGFVRYVRTVHDGKVLLAQGRSAAPEVAGDRGVVVWFDDQTTSQTALLALEAEAVRLSHEVKAAAALMEAAPFPIWQRDRSLALRHVNAAYVAAVEANGATEAVVRGLELVNSALSTAPEKAAKRARDLGRPEVRTEKVIIDGQRRTLQIYDVPLGDAGVGGFALDISGLEESQETMERLTQAQNETLNQISAGVAVFSQDQQLLFHNSALARLFDLDSTQIERQHDFSQLLEFLRQVGRLPEQSDFPRWKAHRLGWFTSVLEPVEETWALPDGTILRVIVQPHPLGGLITIFEDQTEQLTLASSRDTLLKAYQATLNHLHETVAVFASDGRLQLHNEGFSVQFGLEREMLLGEPHVDTLGDLMSPMLHNAQDAQVLRELVRAATLGRMHRSGELKLKDERILDCRAVPLPNGNALVTFVDVTDSRQIELALRDRNEALEAADRLKSQFVSNMSYEFRTPLTSIMGFAQMLDHGYFGSLNEQQGDYVRNILTSADRLQLLISDILDLAVTEAGKLALELSEVDISRMIESVTTMVEDQARGSALILNYKIDPSAGTIEGDERRLKQMLYNLLANSIRQTPAGGSVSVLASGTADTVTLEILDTGETSDPATMQTIFDRTGSAANHAGAGVAGGPAREATVRGPESVGLGLSLVRQFVQLHGGDVEQDTRQPDGNLIRVRLPRKAAEPVGGQGQK